MRSLLISFLCKVDSPLAILAVMFVEFILDSGKIWIFTIRIRLSIIWFKGSQVDFPNRYVLQWLKVAFIIANSADLDYQTTL